MTIARLVLLAWAAFLLFVGPAHAQDSADAIAVLCPGHGALAPLFQAAAERYRIRPVVLVAMARVESSCDTRAVNRRTQSYGPMGIKLDGSANVDNLPPAELLRPEVNIDLGARHLARWLRTCGAIAPALAIYHAGAKRCSEGKGDSYAQRVLWLADWAKRTIAKLQKVRS